MSSRFLLDTNVLSELMRAQPAAAVADWFALNTHAAMYTSTSIITQAEILTGIALLPAGKRRTALVDAAELMFAQDFAGNYLDFDAVAAKNHAVLVATHNRQERPVSTGDAQIAAIALASGLTVATRNTKDFENIEGLMLANPWQATTPY